MFEIPMGQWKNDKFHILDFRKTLEYKQALMFAFPISHPSFDVNVKMEHPGKWSEPIRLHIIYCYDQNLSGYI